MGIDVVTDVQLEHRLRNLLNRFVIKLSGHIENLVRPLLDHDVAPVRLIDVIRPVVKVLVHPILSQSLVEQACFRFDLHGSGNILAGLWPLNRIDQLNTFH